MGKWAARLAEKTAATPVECTDKTAKRGLLSVLAGTPEGGARELHEPLETAQALGAFDMSAVAWTDEDIARFLERRARLVRWGWPTAEAEALAERLTLRDRSQDERVSCSECRHYRPGRCGNHRRAGLISAEVGSNLAGILQRCPGFRP